MIGNDELIVTGAAGGARGVSIDENIAFAALHQYMR